MFIENKFRYTGSVDYIIYFKLWKPTHAQFHVPGENAAQFTAAVTQYQFSLHLEPITGRWTKAMIQSLPTASTHHMVSAAGIELQTPRSSVQRLNHSAMRSTSYMLELSMEIILEIYGTQLMKTPECELVQPWPFSMKTPFYDKPKLDYIDKI